jgi:hypothetical protein
MLDWLSGRDRQRWVRSPKSIVLAVAVGLVYFPAAKLGIGLPYGFLAVFWPAFGIASGILIALGPSARWPVLLAAATANFLAHITVGVLSGSV